MKKEIISLIVVFLIVIGVLVGFLLYNQWPLLTGERFVLATTPVDPFDPIRGQYMQIGYEISQVDTEGFEVGDRIYVVLEEDESGIWRSLDTLKKKPSKGDFIRGKISGLSLNGARIEYGIEQFFFERNAKLPTGNVTVEVAITGSGRAGIVQLLQDGEPIDIDYQDFSWRR